jgi:hypothetical protein
MCVSAETSAHTDRVSLLHDARATENGGNGSIATWCGGDKSLEAKRREPRTHSFRHQGALRRFQRDPAPRNGRSAINKARDMFQSKRIDEFGPGRAALRRVLLEVASIRCTLGIICMAIRNIT